MNERQQRTLRALFLLTMASARRLLREGMVLRSMVWPGLVVVGTLASTIAVLAVLRPSRTVVVALDTPAAIILSLEDADFTVRTVDDPRAALLKLGAAAGIDGDRLWLRDTSPVGVEVEEVMRTELDSPWRPSPSDERPNLAAGQRQGRIISRVLGLLFVMYGAVFGLGSVARDRDNGSLEAELSLPVPRWVGGLARWMASSAVLAVFYALCVLMLAAVVGVEQVGAAIRHGIAACAAGVAVGLGAVGTAGIKQGFSGPFAGAAAVVTMLAGLGGATGVGGIPIASLFGSGSGWPALILALLSGVLASTIYAFRTGRT